MSKPQSSIRDYGYNPNEYDSLYEMETTVTTAGMQARKVEKHSEFMSPNETPSYNDMENVYPDPLHPWQVRYPPLDPTTPGYNWPGETSMPPVLFNCWTNDCCCDGKAMPLTIYCTQKIIRGPYTKTSSGETIVIEKSKYGVDSGSSAIVCYTPVDCSMPKPIYCDCQAPDYKVSGKTMKGQVMRVQVTRLGGSGDCSDCSNKCATSAIHVTSTTMSVSTSQTLTIDNPVAGASYKWKVTAGGGSVSPKYGNTTVYTAPATNPYCTQNPTISLYLNECELCNTAKLAINGAGSGGNQAVSTYGSYRWTDNAPPDCLTYCYATVTRYYCDGTVIAGTPCEFGAYCPGYQCSGDGCVGGYPTSDACKNIPRTIPACGVGDGYTIGEWLAMSPKDERSEDMKANGCCPAGLL